MESDRLVFYLDNRAPAIVRTLSSTGPLDLQGDEVFRLRVRPTWGSDIVLDVPMVVDANQETVTYTPVDGDFNTEGLYQGWITLDPDGNAQDTDEFEIAVFAHAPGEGVRIGAVWRAARGLSPVAWDALRGYRDYGDTELQRVIELAKLRVLRATVSADDESSLDLRVIDFIAKKLLVSNVLPAAIDYWTNMIVMQSARASSNEIKSYPDRIRAVEGQITRFEKQLGEQMSEIDEILGTSGSAVSRAPMLIGGGLPMTTDIDLLPIPGNRMDRMRRGWDESDCL